jgi:3-hydroxyisobutyrate dehydrogenase-like beta-hydroxyacid dehydrogenase
LSGDDDLHDLSSTIFYGTVAAVNTPAIGFIGFGEAGFHLAQGLRGAGVSRISAYDIHTDTPKLGERIQSRARESETRLADSSEDLARSSDVLFSTVTASSTEQAASQTAPYLESRHFYADLNSVSPAVKQSVERIVTGRGARFVEAAVMSPIPPYAHRAPMLLGGAGASAFVELLAPLGMRLEVVGPGVGTASATKMFRSIVVKGMEALLCECVMGASRYEAQERVFASLAETFPGIDWNRLADYMIGRVVEHGERRAREMDEVAETLRSIGVEPMMAEATARRMDWSAQLGLKERFGGGAPKSTREFLEAVAEESHAEARRTQRKRLASR